MKNELEVLKYWLISEYVEQVDFPEIKDSVKKSNADFVIGHTDIHDFTVQGINRLKVVSADEKHPCIGNHRYFAFGKIKRNLLVDYLIKLAKRPELHEYAYEDKTSVAWFTFSISDEGVYEEKSFRLSKLLWAVSTAERSRRHEIEMKLEQEMYQNVIEKIENDILKDKKYEDFIRTLYNHIYTEFIEYIDDEYSVNGICAVYCYKSDEDKLKYNNEMNPVDMGHSFFDADLEMVKEAVNRGQYGSSSYEKAVIQYITAAIDKKESVRRVNVSTHSPSNQMEKFFRETLDPLKSPIGKWPSRFMPSLMQQVAINLAIDENKPQPIFSVNGPPGTGKTTLLKEIIAHYIVKRAKLLCEEEIADNLFKSHETRQMGDGEKIIYHTFKNDKINDYGILVTSCNNAAVENITKDLPKQSDLLDGLNTKNADEYDIKWLPIVADLFDVSSGTSGGKIPVFTSRDEMTKYEDDVFYTYYARRLFSARQSDGKKDYSTGMDNWGLISAPLGKKSNINEYCYEFLSKLFFNSLCKPDERKRHEKIYKEYCSLFLEKYKKVKEIQKKLHDFSMMDSQSQRKMMLESSVYGKDTAVIDDEFMNKYYSVDSGLADAPSTEAQISNPWLSKLYNRNREALFYVALQVHREFVLSSKCVCDNIKLLLRIWGAIQERSFNNDIKCEVFTPAFQTLFLITPVISTTFASMQSLMSNVREKGKFGLLIVDEAGQAPPSMAIGGLFRCRHAMIVGDPKQVEPVVTAETDLIKELISKAELKRYMKKELSVQLFADSLNPYGTYLGEDEEKTWVGCPLVVHRRCIDPMYTISNKLSYDGTMKQQTFLPKAEKEETFIWDKSCWINVQGNEEGKKKHFVAEQGRVVLKLLRKKLEKSGFEGSGIPLYVITPFTSVKNGIQKMVRESELMEKYSVLNKWCSDNIGTVHTFQGKGTDEVIFLLGCDWNAVPAVKWVNKNIVNVAVTRAKFRFYAIGDASLWEQNSAMKVALDHLEKATVEDIADSELKHEEKCEKTESFRKNKYTCPNCSEDVFHGKYGYYCSKKCGMLFKYAFNLYGEELSEEVIEKLLSDEKVNYKYKGKYYSILPDCALNEYNGKTSYIWKCYPCSK